MKKFIFAIAASAALTACGSEKSGSYENSDGEKVDYSIDKDGGESSATITTDEGTATIRSGSDVAIDLPDGFSVYPGAKVVNSTSFKGEGKGGAMVIMQSDASPEEMVTFYRKAAEAAGYKIEMELKTAANTLIGGESSNGKGGFTFSAGNEGDKTNAQLMIGDAFQ